MAEEIINNYPNPWDFHNTDKALISSLDNSRIEYHDLGEIAMGAPIGGRCFWVESNGTKHLIDDFCGGPPVWNVKGDSVAIPVWTRKFMTTVQQLIILDINKRQLTRYKKTFDVLDLRSFDQGIIYGYDSPIYKPKTIKFDSTIEKIANTRTI